MKSTSNHCKPPFIVYVKVIPIARVLLTVLMDHFHRHLVLEQKHVLYNRNGGELTP